jgi:hypothetical protein
MAKRSVADQELRQELVHLLRGRGAHVGFREAVRGLPPEHHGVRPAGLPHTAWQLLEHLRIAQWDILEFCRNPEHVSPPFPDGYWPPGEAPPDGRAWEKSVRAFRRDLRALVELIEDPGVGPSARVAAGTGATVLHEALLVVDHNAYHVGQRVALRRALGAWPE